MPGISTQASPAPIMRPTGIIVSAKAPESKRSNSRSTPVGLDRMVIIITMQKIQVCHPIPADNSISGPKARMMKAAISPPATADPRSIRMQKRNTRFSASPSPDAR